MLLISMDFIHASFLNKVVFFLLFTTMNSSWSLYIVLLLLCLLCANNIQNTHAATAATESPSVTAEGVHLFPSTRMGGSLDATNPLEAHIQATEAKLAEEKARLLNTKHYESMQKLLARKSSLTPEQQKTLEKLASDATRDMFGTATPTANAVIQQPKTRSMSIQSAPAVSSVQPPKPSLAQVRSVSSNSTTTEDNTSVALEGTLLSIRVNIGGQTQLMYVSNTDPTAVAAIGVLTGTAATSGYSKTLSTTSSFADVCASPPCVVTTNSTQAFGISGFVAQDRLSLVLASNVTRLVSAQFVDVTSKNGPWPFNIPLVPPKDTVQTGSFGIMPTTLECVDSTCWTGPYRAILTNNTLPNIVSVCANYTTQSNIFMGGIPTSMYKDEISYVSIAGELGATVPAQFADAVIVNNMTYNGVDLTNGEGRTAIGEYVTMSTSLNQMLLSPETYKEFVAALGNAINPLLELTANTTGLVNKLYLALETTTEASRAALPPLALTLQATANTTLQISIPASAFLLTRRGKALNGLPKTLVTVAFNETTTLDSTAPNFTNYTKLGLPAYYASFVVLNRNTSQIGFAERSAAQCGVGCDAYHTEITCRQHLGCGWLGYYIFRSGAAGAICTEGTVQGPSNPTINTWTVTQTASMQSTWNYGPYGGTTDDY